MPDKMVVATWTVLVVDDEPDSLEVAMRVLKFHGAGVLTAANGKEALEILEMVRPTFIISDLSMPVMDGWEFRYNVEQNPALADIPIIALTAHAMPGDRERAVGAGFRYYLTKPLSPMTFLDNLLLLIDQMDDEMALTGTRAGSRIPVARHVKSQLTIEPNSSAAQ